MVIRRDGQLTQYVPFGERAWHAGVSQYRTRSGCNDFSVGVELEGTDDIAYTDAQYAQLVELIAALSRPIPRSPPSTSSGTATSPPGARAILAVLRVAAAARAAERAAQGLKTEGYFGRSWRQSTSVPRSCRASTRAMTNNRSERRLRYFTTSGLTDSARASVQTRRSARRATVRAR